MNYKEINTLTINGVKLQGDAIVNYCTHSKREDLQQLGLFVKLWLNNNDFVELKTSGSTGEPKIILVEKNQMVASAALTAEYFGFEEGQAALLCLPIQYIAGKMMAVRAMVSGLNLICLPPSGNPLASLPPDIEIDFAPLLPMQVTSARSVGGIKKILLGGAPVDLQLEKKLQSFSSEIFHGYGMTETLSHVALRRVNGSQRSDVYNALNGIQFGSDERDCLVIQVPFLQHAVITNDVVELFSSVTFKWKGRFDFVVNSGGIKLFPEEIEKKIANLISNSFFMAGIPDERFGEQLCLFIESDSLEEDQTGVLRTAMHSLLEKYEMPRQIFFIAEFKRTGSGKINRNETISEFLIRH